MLLRAEKPAWTRVVVEAVNRFLDAEAYRLAASMSFYALSSVFPLLLVAVAVGDLTLGDSAPLQRELISVLNGTRSPAVRGVLEEALTSARGASSRGNLGLVVGVVGATFGASGIFLELDSAMEKLFAISPAKLSFVEGVKRFVRERAAAFVLVLCTSALLLVSTAAFGSIGVVQSLVPLDSPFLFELMTRGAAFGVLLLALTLCYRVVPDLAVTWRSSAIGAGVTAVLLSLAGPPLGWATRHLTNYAAYGVVGAFLLLSTWFYVAGNLLLFGGALAAVSNERQNSRARAVASARRRSIDAQ